MQLSNHLDEEFGDELPPTALFVYWALLDAGEPLTTAAIAEKTMLASRTIRNGLSELRDHDLAVKQPIPNEPRGVEYSMTTPNDDNNPPRHQL